MTEAQRERLRRIRRFDQLLAYLRDELDWPIDEIEIDDLTFEYEPDELGIDAKTAAKIETIKQLRPLSSSQPWGIFFVKFEPKQLPVVALRRILSQLVIKKRASVNKSEQASWEMHDLLFISNYGEDESRKITFAHFAENDMGDLPTLKVLGWDEGSTPLHFDDVHAKLHHNLIWPGDEDDLDSWREGWASAFVLRHREVITTSQQLAVRLADLAHDIREKVNEALAVESEKGPLRKMMKAFKDALIHDLNEDDFADMYAQTISYGLLTARISRPAGLIADNLADMVPITNPFLKELMQSFLHAGGRRSTGIDFDELGINDVVELLRDANMEAVLRDFGATNPDVDPVIHFYEVFLKEYDAKKRMQRGVFYTPKPVVSYIVRSVHELLQTEFGLKDGLADITTWGEMLKRNPELKLPPLTDGPDDQRTISSDEPFVQILDPATGTATFLVEVIDIIHNTLTEKWRQQRLSAEQQKQAWNEYVPNHLLPRLHAYELMMAPYAIAHMKIGLKLAETGYSFSTEERARIYLTNALEPWVKQPPIIGFEALAHEAEAVNEIKKKKQFTVVIGNPPYSVNSANRTNFTERLIQPYLAGLMERYVKPIHDDYIKFVALAQNKLSRCRPSVVGMITNNGYLGGVIHRKMREAMLGAFQRLHIVDMHGNSLIKDRTEAGLPDENVFDIQQGVAILLASKGLRHCDTPQVFVADLRGGRQAKYDWLAKKTAQTDTARLIAPKPENYFFTSTVYSNQDEYDSFAELRLLFPHSSIGILTNRDWLVVAFTRDELVSRLEAFFDSTATDAEIVARFSELGVDGWWDYKSARRPFLEKVEIESAIVKVLYRPFDVRYIFLSSRLVNRPRLEVMEHMLKPNMALIISRITKNNEFDSCLVSQLPIEQKCAESTRGVYCMPLYSWEATGGLFGDSGKRCAISQKYVSQFPSKNPEDIFHYAYAVFHSPGYRSRYAEFLKIDFPRLPLIGNLALFRALALLGGELADLHLLESSKLDKPITELTGSSNPTVEKVSWSENTVWVDKAKTSGFKGVREEVWNFHIGGYQVCEKWLKDRQARGGKRPRIGRVLSDEDVSHYQKIVVSLSETIRIMAEIDEVIEAHGGWPGAFVTEGAESE